MLTIMRKGRSWVKNRYTTLALARANIMPEGMIARETTFGRNMTIWDSDMS